MFGTLRNLLKDEAGATAIEYGLIAALVSVVIIVALQMLGASLFSTFEYIAETVEGAGSSGGTPTP